MAVQRTPEAVAAKAKPIAKVANESATTGSKVLVGFIIVVAGLSIPLGMMLLGRQRVSANETRVASEAFTADGIAARAPKVSRPKPDVIFERVESQRHEEAQPAKDEAKETAKEKEEEGSAGIDWAFVRQRSAGSAIAERDEGASKGASAIVAARS